MQKGFDIFDEIVSSLIIISKLVTFLLELEVQHFHDKRFLVDSLQVQLFLRALKRVSFHSYSVWVLIVSLDFSTLTLHCSLLPRVWDGKGVRWRWRGGGTKCGEFGGK